MKLKLFIAALGALALAGCASVDATLVSSSVNPNYAATAVSTFNAIETAADGYLRLPACVTGGSAVCRNAEAVAQIVPLIRSGRKARNQVLAALNASNGAAITVTPYNALNAIVQTLQGLYATYGITKG